MSSLIWEYTPVKDKWIRLLQGDLTEEKVDAIVNAANSNLAHGGGVAGAIVRKGGSIIQEESNKIGHVPVGNCAVTGSGKLPAKYIIHAVGPVWGEGDEDNKLANAISNSLKKANELNLKTISFPAISSGIFGFPKDRCARILLNTSVDYFLTHPGTSISEIRFCLIDQLSIDVFQQEFDKIINT